MRRPTYAALAESVEGLRRDKYCLDIALSLVCNTKPDAVETIKGDSPGQRYVLKLYGAQRACGGVVITTFYCRGQSPTTSAHYLDNLRIGLPSLDMRCAVDRLIVTRNKLLEAAP